MKHENLDRLFDESSNRLTTGTGALSGAYGASPLAADHLLLKRSWDYFRHRIQTIEDQWHKILEAKDAETKALVKQLEMIKAQERDLALENTAYKSFEYEYGRSKAEDYLQFKKDTERLRTQWEEEREVLMRTQSDLELKILQLETESDRAQEEFQQRELKWKEALAAAQAQTAALMERHKARQDEWLAESARKDADNKDLTLKIDILRAEIENREQVLKRLKEDVFAQERQKTELASHLALAMGKIRELEGERSVLTERYEILSREKEAIREQWAREQAEWRELWDRQRAMWEDVDSK